MIGNRVMVVDHYDATLDLIEEILRGEGLAALCHPSWPLSAACVEQARADLLILELELGDPIGALELLRELRQRPSTAALPVIVNSTNGQLLEQLAQELNDLGCVILAKPFELETFLTLVRICLGPVLDSRQRRPCRAIAS